MANDKRFLDGKSFQLTDDIEISTFEFEREWKKGFVLFKEGKIVGNDSDSFKDSCFVVNELPSFEERTEIKIKMNKCLEIFINKEVEKLINNNKEIQNLKRKIRKKEKSIEEVTRKKYKKLHTSN